VILSQEIMLSMRRAARQTKENMQPME